VTGEKSQVGVDGARRREVQRTRRHGRRGDLRRKRVDALVLDADERQSLVSVRSLGRAGLTVGVLDCRAGAPAFHSRHATFTGLLPPREAGSAAFVAGLLDWVERYEPRSVICAHDGTVEALRSHRNDLEPHVRLALAGDAALEVAIDKERTLDLAASLDLETPASVLLASERDLVEAVKEVGLPLVVKSVTSWTSGGERMAPVVAVTALEARQAADTIWSAGGNVIVQKWVPGAREAINLFRDGGRIVARFAQIAHRMHPPLGGCSVVRESVPLPPDATEAAEKLVDAAGLDGYSEVEFRRDAAGRPVLMEVNPRLSASVELGVRSGVDFPLMLYEWSIGESVRERRGYRIGVRMRWLGGDLRWLFESLRTQGRPDVEPRRRVVWLFASEFARRSSYDYLSLGDPMPAAVAVTGLVRRVRGRRAEAQPPLPERATA